MAALLFTTDGHIALAQAIYQVWQNNQLYLGWGTLPPFLGAPTNLTAVMSVATPSTLSASTYIYSVTALTANGESTASTPVTISESVPGASIVLTWSAISGATGYNVYGRMTGTGQNLLATNVSTPTWTDTGSGILSLINPSSVDSTSLTPWTTTPTTPNVAQHTLLQEVGRRKVALCQYVLPSNQGSIITANGTWAVSQTATRYLYCYTNFALTDAPTSTIYQYGFFTATVAVSGLNNANYLTPGQLASPGTLLCLQNIAPIYRDSSSMETHSTVMTF